MKRILLCCLLIILTNISFSQVLPDFKEIKLVTKEHYNQTADSAALTASNFLFSTKFDKNKIDRLECISYIIRWMSGTPEYNFTLDQKATKFAKKNDDLLGMYMAGMTKYVLENKSESKDENKIKLGAIRLIIKYVKDENSNVKLNTELKKLIAADEKGTLETYFD